MTNGKKHKSIILKTVKFNTYTIVMKDRNFNILMRSSLPFRKHTESFAGKQG